MAFVPGAAAPRHLVLTNSVPEHRVTAVHMMTIGTSQSICQPGLFMTAAAGTAGALLQSRRVRRRRNQQKPRRRHCRERTGRLMRSATSTVDGASNPVSTTGSQSSRPRVAVIGAGWGGFGAAKALCENDCEVILIDGNPDPTGSTPSLTPTGKPFEPGTRGFWRDYPNMNQMLSELGIKEEDVFSDFTESAFYGPDGLEATAPVFGDALELPSPLGQVFASFSRFKRLPLADRASIAGLLLAMIDFTRDAKTFEAYDRMTAHELFVRTGASKRLVDNFLKPTLLVGLFKPPEELSAAVTMELLYFYALAHQTSFDVRWLRKGTVSETLIQPLAQQLISEYGLDVRGSCFAEGLILTDGKVSGVRCRTRGDSASHSLEDLDAVVLALGAGGMRAVMSGSPEVARRCPNLSAAGSLKGIDVMSCRLWLTKYVSTETPANVLSRFEGLRGAGGTFFMLDQLQPDQVELWGGEEPQGSVVACDFYNAGALLALSDDDIVSLLINELLPASVPEFAEAQVADSCVRRYAGAVTWFSPGSYKSRPSMETPISNLVCAGDWVRLGNREHGAKGLCQERAFVTGFEAANSLARRGIFGPEHANQHPVIPIRDDEPQVQVGRTLNRLIMQPLEPLGLSSPWVR